MAIPRSILDAQNIDFGVNVTGYLCCTEFQPPCLIGIVFTDARGRFADGRRIRTSKIEKVFQLQGYLLCETFSGSRYVICHWWHENGTVPVVNMIH